MQRSITTIRPFVLSTIVFLHFWTIQATAEPIRFDRYHSQTEINEYLANIAQEQPEVFRLHKLGESQQGREIFYLTATLRSDLAGPAIYLNGTHHGDEKSSTEAVLGLINDVATNTRQANIQNILKSFVLILQPIINPDGHVAHRRGDAIGRDPNRDYAFPNRPVNESFYLPEIALIQSLLGTFAVKGALAFHSGMEGILWPWCYSADTPPQQSMFLKVAKKVAQVMGFRKYLQSYFDYPTQGEFIDYAYMQHGTLALTVEVSTTSTPPASALPGIIQKSLAGTYEFIEQVDQLLRPQPVYPIVPLALRGR